MRAISIVLFSLAAVFSLAVQASAEDWYEGEYQTCAGEASTMAIVECVDGLFDTWDGRLNVAYRELIGNYAADRKDAFRDVQRSWIAYRDANCGFYRSGEGTIAAIEGNVCMFAMTRERAIELEAMTQP